MLAPPLMLGVHQGALDGRLGIPRGPCPGGPRAFRFGSCPLPRRNTKISPVTGMLQADENPI